MMEIDVKKYKMIEYEFRIKAKNVLNCSFEDFISNLKRFINYIDTNELLKQFILDHKLEVNKCIIPENEIKELNESFGQGIFDFGDSEQEEITNIYILLKYFVENNINPRSRIFYGYACDSHKYQDMIDGFNERVTKRLIEYIELYLRGIGIQMGLDDNNVTNYNINGQMVNVANNQATINATQINNDIEKLNSLIDKIRVNLNDVDENIQNEINDSLDVLKDNYSNNTPKNSIIRMCKKSLEFILPKIPKAIELTAAITEIIAFISTYC